MITKLIGFQLIRKNRSLKFRERKSRQRVTEEDSQYPLPLVYTQHGYP